MVGLPSSLAWKSGATPPASTGCSSSFIAYEPPMSPTPSTATIAATMSHCWRTVIGYTRTAQRDRSAAISALGSFDAKIAFPATKVSAPASHTS